MRGIFDSLIDQNGLPFEIHRNGTYIGTTKGIFSRRNSIELKSEPDIYEGDLLYQPRMGKSHKVILARPQLGLHGEGVAGWEVEYEIAPSQPTQTININAIHGHAVVGSQENVTFNFGVTIDEIKSLIAQKPIEDQAELAVMVSDISNAKDISKGRLAQFKKTLSKYEDIMLAVGKLLLKFAMGTDT